MTGSPPPEEATYDDELDHDRIMDHAPQQVDINALLENGWEFDAQVQELSEEPAVDQEEKREYFSALAKLTEDGHSLAEFCHGLDDDNDSVDTRMPFAVLREKMWDLSGDGGVMKLVRVHGSGPQVTPGCTVRLHYVGQFEGHDEPFDSTFTRHRSRPDSFVVGDQSTLLPGLNLTVLSMRKGETCLALLRPDYAYGKLGCGPRVPPDTEALFEVTVVSFADASEAAAFDRLPPEQQRQSGFQQRVRAIRAHHADGNDAYAHQQFQRAAKSYREGIRIFLDNMSFKDEVEHDEAKHLIFKVMSNRVQALLKTAQWKEAARQGRQALHYEDCADTGMRVKLYTRLAKAMIYLPEYEEASRYLQRAQRLEPRSRDVLALSQLLAKRQRSDQRQEVEFAKRALSRSTQGGGGGGGDSASRPAAGRATTPVAAQDDQEEAAAAADPQECEIRVTAAFRASVERRLSAFLADAGQTELSLPLLHTEQGHHQLAHICVRCRQLGLKLVRQDGPPRVVKPRPGEAVRYD